MFSEEDIRDLEKAPEAMRHLALVAEIGTALITGPSLRDALQRCAEAIVRHLDAAFARIWVLDEKEQVLELLASAGMYTHIDGFHSRLHLWKYPFKVSLIARERKPHLTNSVIGDPMIHDQEWAKREGMVAFAGYPLIFRDKVVGVVGMFAKRPLTMAAIKALESIADQITIGIERIRSAEELGKSEEMLRSLVEESLAGTYIIQDGQLKYINQAMADIYGYSKEELSKVWLEGVCLPEDYGKEREMNEKLLSGEVSNIRYEARRCNKDGKIIYLDFLRWRTEYEGRPALIGTALDVTDRKNAEEALKESQAKFRSLSEEALIGISMVQDFRRVYANPEFCRMLGYTEAELLELDLFDIVHPEDREKAREGIADIQSGRKEKVRYQGRWVRKDGRTIEVEGSAGFTTFKGRPALITTALDVTERKALERDKADFLAMVSHDFKSPLTNILGYSELLQEKGREKAAEEVCEMAGAINRSGRKLYGMVEDFLFHSRLESGTAAPEKTPGDLEGLLRGACDDCETQAEKKGLSLSLDVRAGLPRVSFDKRLLERAVHNLLQNALTYTPEGGKIAVTADWAKEDERDFIVISVSDTGPGIPAEFQTRIFEKYFRAPSSAGVRGTGLGLAVVKLVADAHSGKAEVDCSEGAGCTFRIVLPADTGAHDRKAA